MSALPPASPPSSFLALHPLKLVLKRGALVAAANWQVTLVQATADFLFKILVATPLVGGVFLVGLVVGTEPRDLMALEWREMATTIVSSLLAHPLVLLMFLLAVAVIAIGGTLFVFLVKAGTVAVLVRGERDAGDIEQHSIHIDTLVRLGRFTPEFYIAASRSLFPRYARLGTLLLSVYFVSGAGYLAAVVALGVTGDALGFAALLTAAFVAWITLLNLLYLLVQIVIAADDCSVTAGARRAVAFVRHERRRLGEVFLLVLVLVVMATGASWLAMGALALIGFVPLMGLAVIPLQLIAWLFRSIVFQFLGLTSVGAYVKLYRGYAGEALDNRDESVSPLSIGEARI